MVFVDKARNVEKEQHSTDLSIRSMESSLDDGT